MDSKETKNIWIGIIIIALIAGAYYFGTRSSTIPVPSTSSTENIQFNNSPTNSPTVFYTQAIANIRSCASTSCASLGTYPVNTDLSLPYATVNDLPEWISFSLPDSNGVAQTGYINKINLGTSKIVISEKTTKQITPVVPVKNGYQVCNDMNATWDGTSYTSSGGFNCTCKTGYVSGSDGKSCVVVPQATNQDKLNACLTQEHNVYLRAAEAACLQAGYTQADFLNFRCFTPPDVQQRLVDQQAQAQALCAQLYK